MTASPAGWLPAAFVRIPTARRPTTPARSRGRHHGVEFPGMAESVATEVDLARTGRHAEPDWARQLFDPARDDMDTLDWLGFQAPQP